MITDDPADRPRSGDVGVTLVELMVGMSIMSVLGMIVVGALLQMYRATGHVQDVTTTQQQLTVAFARLDREIRYTSGIDAPRQSGGDWTVAFVTVNTGVATCTQLRLDAAKAQLQRRRWSLGEPGTTMTGWLPLASGVASDVPFTSAAADPPRAYPQLRVQLTASSGQPGRLRSSFDVSFSALNGTPVGTEQVTSCSGEGQR